jgi:hypothetical protein
MIALCLCVTITSTSFGDELYEAQVHARQMRKSGAGLMGVGLIHLGAGLALSFAIAGMSAECSQQPFPCGEGIGFIMAPAFSLVALGGLLTGVGMPLFFVGRRRERRLGQPALIPTPMGQLTPVPPMPQ